MVSVVDPVFGGKDDGHHERLNGEGLNLIVLGRTERGIEGELRGKFELRSGEFTSAGQVGRQVVKAVVNPEWRHLSNATTGCLLPTFLNKWLYCGRTLLDFGNWSECGACPRGFRTNSSFCFPCSDEPAFYDWLYLAFMVLVALVLHWFWIDYLASRRRQSFTMDVCPVHLSAAIEVCVAAVATVLIVEPMGSFHIKSCRTVHFSDWYTLFHNPTPNYEKTLYCTQEAVFPLYTMVFIFYAIATVVMLLIRPKCTPHGKISVYIALYFYPILAFFQAVFGGIIYYTFPYIVIIASLISNAIHFAHKEDQSMISLTVTTVTNVRNIVILIGHWIFHAYGIIAITELKKPHFHWSLLALVPLPTVFYILTAKFTNPSKLHVK